MRILVEGNKQSELFTGHWRCGHCGTEWELENSDHSLVTWCGAALWWEMQCPCCNKEVRREDRKDERNT